MRVPDLIAWPQITDLHRDYVDDALTHGITKHAQRDTLCREFSASQLDSQDCMFASSCTHGIHAVLTALGVGPGDNVVVPALGWHGTVQPVLYLGATPIFADVSVGSYNITPETVKAAVSGVGDVRAVLAVHTHGRSVDIPGIRSVVPDAVIIEDACQAHGSFLGSKPVGTMGDAAVFSSNSVKSMPAGNGAIITARDPRFMDDVRTVCYYGAGPADNKRGVGYNYSGTEIDAALARASLALLPRTIALARRNALVVCNLLADTEGVRPPTVPIKGREHTWHKFRMLVDPEAMPAIISAVPISRWQTRPLPYQPAYARGAGTGQFPGAQLATENHLILGTESHPLGCQTLDWANWAGAAIRKQGQT